MPHRMQVTPATTLAEARADTFAHIDTPGVICPCCDQAACRRRRHLHASMAAALIILARYFRNNTDQHWVHVENYLKTVPDVPSQLRGDFPKLVHWGLLVERVIEREDGHPRSGEYRLTRNGYLFVDGRLRVHRTGWMYNSEFWLDYHSPLINVRDALGDNFNYDELMGFQ